MGAGSRTRRIHENLGKAGVITNDSQSGRLLLYHSKNAALNYLAKEERQKQITEIIADKIADQENSPEEILINEELFSHYVKALDRLPEKCREIFIRIREEKQSYAQVAKELKISINTVDVQLQKAVTRLRDMLSRYLKPDKNGS